MMKYLFVVLAIFLIALPARADHELDIYSFDNLFIYDTFTRGSALKTIHIVVLDDDKPLTQAGAVQSRIDANVDAFSHYKNFLIVLLWNNVEIFDVRDPRNPRLAKTFKLEEHKPWPGYGRIMKGGNTFLLLSTRASARLIMDDTIEKCRLEPFDRTEEIHHATLTRPPFPEFNDRHPFAVKESPNFTYEIRWKTKKVSEYEWSHEKYLVKIRKNDNSAASEMLLGSVIETGGN